MHELSVTQHILEIAISSAQNAEAKKINKIKIAVGEMTGYLPACVQDYFDIISKGTIAESAELEFMKIPPLAKCLDCEKETSLDGFKFICAHCGGQNLKLIHGREFLVESIDIDT